MQCEPIIAGEFVKSVKPLIEKAARSIDICVFDWRWYPSDPAGQCQLFNQSIIQAARRGVKVRALVNNQNVESILKNAGIDVKRHISAHLLHTKLMIIDEKIVITGSHNYTQSAFCANCELSVILSEIECMSKFSQFFNSIWSK